MEKLYFYCAVIGGAILVLQVILILFGSVDGDVDADADADFDTDLGAHADATDAFFKVLSFKTIVAFFTFFGLSGLACLQAELSIPVTLLVSLAAGFAALYIVAWMMAGLSKLQSSGNIDLRNAVGTAGKIYLTVPGRGGGHGKITVAIQGRTIQAKAITSGAELKTGMMATVVGMPAADTLEVCAMAEEE